VARSREVWEIAWVPKGVGSLKSSDYNIENKVKFYLRLYVNP